MWSWLWSWWDTIEGVETFNLVMLIFLGTAAVLAAVGTVGNVLAGRQLDWLKSQRDAAQQAEQAAREQELRQRIAEREQELREVQAHQRPRTLTEAQIKTLVTRLRNGPTGRIWLYPHNGDAEASQFAQLLRRVIVAGRWTIEGFSELDRVGEAQLGLTIERSRVDPPGKLLLRTLREVGLEVSEKINPDVADGVVWLIVGQKPWPRR